jgi:hypothetical protein
MIPSTLVPSQTEISTSTSAEAEESTLSGTSKSSPPNIAAIAGGVTAAIAVVCLAVLAFICWRLRNRTTQTQRGRRKGIRGSVDRTDTVKTFLVGREETDDSSGGLFRGKTLKFWTSQQPISSRGTYTGIGVGDMAMSGPDSNQPSPPQLPPRHLNPMTMMDTRVDRVPQRPGHASSFSSSSNPFATPTHSRSGSYDPYDRHPNETSTTNNLSSTSLPFSKPFATKPFASWDGGRPPSSVSSVGTLQEKHRTWTAWERAALQRRAATEGSAPHAPALSASGSAAARHSAPVSAPIRHAVNDRGHGRNLSIDTTNLSLPRPAPRRPPDIAPPDARRRVPRETALVAASVPTEPKPDIVHDTDAPAVLVSPPPKPKPKTRSNTVDEAADKLGQMFACDPSPSEDPHDAMRRFYQTSPTEGGHDQDSPAAPESTTMGMWEVGFGVMGRKWEPRSADAHSNAHGASRSSSKQSAKSLKAPRSTGSLRALTKRGAAVPPISLLPNPSAGTGAATRPGPGRTPKMLDVKLPSEREGEWDVDTQASTGTMSASVDVQGRGPSPAASPRGKETIFEIDENAPSVPKLPMPDAGTPDLPLSGEADTFEGEGVEVEIPAAVAGDIQVTPLTPRIFPPRRSVVPEDFPEDGQWLSRESTQRWG